jgi:hypothetical protein
LKKQSRHNTQKFGAKSQVIHHFDDVSDERDKGGRTQQVVVDPAMRRDRSGTQWHVIVALVMSALALLASGWQALETRRTVEVSRLAAENATRQWLATERPWVSAEVNVIKDLTFDSSGVAVLGTEVVLQNSGKSPALSTRVVQYLVVDYSPGVGKEAELSKGRCDPLRADQENFGYPIFPGATERVTDEVRVSKQTLDAAIAKNDEMLERRFPSGGEFVEKWKGRLSPALVTCIDYRVSPSGEHHQTRYFALVGPRPDPFSMSTALAPNGTYKDTKLWRLIFGHFAD